VQAIEDAVIVEPRALPLARETLGAEV